MAFMTPLRCSNSYLSPLLKQPFMFIFILIPSHLLSSQLISSPLTSPHPHHISFYLISSPLISSHLIYLISSSSHHISSHISHLILISSYLISYISSHLISSQISHLILISSHPHLILITSHLITSHLISSYLTVFLLQQCAVISKYAGGIGLACHNVRASNSYIRGTNGSSNGIVPMLRVFNNTARYVDQGGGKRKGT